MVVNAAIADKVVDVFRRIYQADYRIERMVLIDNYDADDESSMCQQLLIVQLPLHDRIYYQNFQAWTGPYY